MFTNVCKDFLTYLFIPLPKLVRTHNTNYEPVECVECGVDGVYTHCHVCVKCHSRPCSNHRCDESRKTMRFFDYCSINIYKIWGMIGDWIINRICSESVV